MKLATTPSTSLGVPADYIAPFNGPVLRCGSSAPWNCQPAHGPLQTLRSTFHTGSLGPTHMYASAISLQLLCRGGEALHMAIWEVVHGVFHLTCIGRLPELGSPNRAGVRSMVMGKIE